MCTGGWLDTAWCSLRTWLIPSTPLGPQIAAWRYFFLLFDLMPILAKAVLSLRRVRPYDEVEAGLALISRVRMLNSVDWQLNQVGADWEDRAAERRSRRAISSAMVFAGPKRATHPCCPRQAGRSPGPPGAGPTPTAASTRQHARLNEPAPSAHEAQGVERRALQGCWRGSIRSSIDNPCAERYPEACGLHHRRRILHGGAHRHVGASAPASRRR